MEGFDGFEEGFSETKSGRLFLLHREGSGQSIVFLHGVGSSVRSWRRLTPFLPVNLNVYLVDLLGHGQSDAPPINYDIMAQADAVRELIISLKIREPVLFGHSYGAWLAAHYSIANKTSGIILEDSAGLEMQIKEIKGSGREEEYARQLVAESVRIGANEMVMRSTVSNFDKYLLTKEVLSRISARTLLLWGSNDNVVDLRFGQWEHDSIPGSRMLVIPDADHIPHWITPAAVGKAIAEFCGLPS